MKTLPILYKTEMVQSIHDRIKNETRRTKGLKEINKDPYSWLILPTIYPYQNQFVSFRNKKTGKIVRVNFPYGFIDDILWVRETWQYNYDWIQGYGTYVYKTENPPKSIMLEEKWKPSIYMPKDACRLFLKVTKVRIERLWDITDKDAIREGIKKIDDLEYKNYLDDTKFTPYPKQSFLSLWESINGKESLDSNPWVWVYGFEITEKPEGWPATPKIG